MLAGKCERMLTTKLILESSDIPSAGKKRTVSRYLCCIPGSSSPFSRGTFIVFWLAGCGFMDVRIFSTFFRTETRLLLSRMAFRMLCRSSGDTIPDKEKTRKDKKWKVLSTVKCQRKSSNPLRSLFRKLVPLKFAGTHLRCPEQHNFLIAKDGLERQL